MTNDLFAPTMRRSKKQQLLEWIQENGCVKTHEVIAWGLAHYTNGAERYARKLAEEGKLRRLNDLEKFVKFGKVKEDVWEATCSQ